MGRGRFITGASVGLGLLSGVLLLLFGLLLYAAAERWQFSGRGARIGWGTGVGLCAAASAGLAYGAALYALTPLWAVLGSYLLALLACLAAPRIAQPTEYRLEMAGRLLGLRKFIEESELPRIRALAAENPEYFYDVPTPRCLGWRRNGPGALMGWPCLRPCGTAAAT